MDQKSKKSWFGAVFGMIFVVCGLAAAYGSAGKMIVGYIATSSWVEVPATIHRVELVRSYGETTTYTVKSAYSYSINGVDYKSKRVSLSTGSDNIGRYWQDLQRSLLAQKKSNEAFAIVNPNDPTESLLDRKLRWKSIVFGSVFLILFVGIGGFVVWISLRETKSRKDRLQHEQDQGISSNEKTGSWFLAAFGGVFLVMGGGMSLIAIPDAIREGNYAALLILIFAVAGVGIIYSAFKINRAYRRFGPTPLFLDPSVPGVGGQLGGRFKINIPGNGHTSASITHLHARLLCTSKRKSGKNTSRTVKWHEEAPVYLVETAAGIEGSFLFDIPDTCTASKEWSGSSSIEWSVVVEGDFNANGLGKFERSWEVQVEDHAAQASNVLNIPQSFLEKAKLRSDDRIKTSALHQVPVTQDTQYINVHSRAGRYLGSKLIGAIVGGVFTSAGIFTIMEGWWPGYIFLLIGSAVALASIHSMGKSIRVKIDRDSLVLYAQASWCGLKYSLQQGDIIDAEQFKIKKTSSTSSHKKVVEYYAIDLKFNGNKIRIADGIEGKKEALALVDAIVDRCFNGEAMAIAA